MQDRKKLMIDNIEHTVARLIDFILQQETAESLLTTLKNAAGKYSEPTESYTTGWGYWFFRGRVKSFKQFIQHFERYKDHLALLENIKNFFKDEKGAWKNTSANTFLLTELIETHAGCQLSDHPSDNEFESFQRQFILKAEEKINAFHQKKEDEAKAITVRKKETCEIKVDVLQREKIKAELERLHKTGSTKKSFLQTEKPAVKKIDFKKLKAVTDRLNSIFGGDQKVIKNTPKKVGTLFSKPTPAPTETPQLPAKKSLKIKDKYPGAFAAIENLFNPKPGQ